MILCFTLSMPGRASWNGGWSGEGRNYAILKTYKTAKAGARAAQILAHGSYFYNWSDGWGACIDVREVTPEEARKIRKESDSRFSGYGWMVESIERYGKIYADHEIPKEARAGEASHAG